MRARRARDRTQHHHAAGRAPRRGDVLELRVESVAHGGAGVAPPDRYVVFVDGAFPGELVRAEVHRAKRDYANARAVEVLEPSPDRVPIRCDHEGGRAPGSPWQPLRYERQLQCKHELVDDALRRLGHLEGFELEPIVPAADAWRYRNKMEYSFGHLRGRNARSRVSRARALGRGRRRARLHACVRAQQRRPQPRPRLVRGAGSGRDRPPRAGGAACATSSCARAAAPATCRCGW